MDGTASKAVADGPAADPIDNKSSGSPLTQFIEAALAILTASTAYQLIPDSGKVVVFDAALPVKHAFYGLVEHGMSHPLTCSL
jgi:hypothetical protein